MLFDNVRLFDAARACFHRKTKAVLAGDGKIKAIAAAGSITPPPNVRVIDGRGKTLVPGLWDSHLHIGDDWNVLLNMATGITSFRSPVTDTTGRSTRPSGGSRGPPMGEPFVARSSTRSTRSPPGGRGGSSQEERSPRVRKRRLPGCGCQIYTSMNRRGSHRRRRSAPALGCRCSVTCQRPCGRSTRLRPV